MLNKLIEYFDLASEMRKERQARALSEGTERTLHWLPQYLALLLGIFVQPHLQNYRLNKVWQFEGFGWLLASIIIGVIILPAIYKKVFDPEKPLIVQCCTIFVSGLGWQGLLETSKAAVL